TKNVVPAKLQENDFSAPYAAKLKVLQEAKGTFHYLPTGGIFARKNADSYTAGIAAGMRGESSFLQLKGLSEIHTIRGYAEIMAAQNWGKSGLTLLGSLGPMYEQETPLWEHQEGASLYRPSVISGHVGYAFQYMPFEQRIAHGGSVGIDVQMPYIDFPQDVRIGAKTLLFPTVDDYWIFLGAHLKF
ncbi:MAG: hypothetical protein HY540_00565, partial [Deltaproteobacteria bacterium]|nr:hypothetical protein [Deltaproteobacteria bacterium]